MQLNKKLGALLIGAGLLGLPTLSKAAPALTPGQTFYYGGYKYVVEKNNESDETEFGDAPDASEVREMQAYLNFVKPTFGDMPSGYELEEYPAPFDAGLSILLGAGAIAGIKRARARKQAASTTTI